MNREEDKSNVVSIDTSSIEATDWVTRLKSEKKTSEMQTELRDWLDRDPANAAELDLMAGIWETSGILKDHPLVVNETLETETRFYRDVLQRWQTVCRFSVSGVRSLAVVVLALLIVGSLWLVQPNGVSRSTHRTVTGEQKTVYLPDGSIIYLDTETVLTTALTEDLRRIDLKKGRALFAVNRDSSRPFIVTAGHISVRALGTKFSVYKEAKGKVSVAVTEGEVQVSRPQEKPVTDAVPVKSILRTMAKEPGSSEGNRANEAEIAGSTPDIIIIGQEITVDKDQQAYEVRSVDIEDVDAWRKGKLVFRRTRLEYVIEEINRYLERKIVIGDRCLDDTRITAVYNITDREYFLETLKNIIPVVAELSSNGETVLLKQEEISPDRGEI